MVKRVKRPPVHEAGKSPAVRSRKPNEPTPVGSIPGLGRWLVVHYRPVSLFSLKTSLATSTVGKTNLVPSPYAIKMACVDAAFRAGMPDKEVADFLRSLAAVDVRVSPPDQAVVTHTFVKIRQEPHGGSRPGRPYIPSIAYREVVHHQGLWRWAFDLDISDPGLLVFRLILVAPYIAYVGKRGSFLQFVSFHRVAELDSQFTQPIDSQTLILPQRSHIASLDDFGPEADLTVLSSFSTRPAKRDRHRLFVKTVIPLGLVNLGPGFSEYCST